MKLKFTAFISFLLFCFNAPISGQTVDHWETVVYNTNVWRYFIGDTEPPSSWRTLTFDDSQWEMGMGGIGYGDNDDNTVIPQTISVYLRRNFEITDTAKISFAILHADYDDAFVAYLNGIEIARQNVGEPGIPPTHDQTAYDYHEAALYNGGVPEMFTLSSSTLDGLLNEGDNVLTVQVHNQNINSSDLSGNFFFSVGISDESMTYGDTPDWFYAPITSSNHRSRYPIQPQSSH